MGEVQEAIKPVLNAYIKVSARFLQKCWNSNSLMCFLYCSSFFNMVKSFHGQDEGGLVPFSRLTINILVQGDVEVLKKYCSPELIERCKAEHAAYQSNGIFFDNKARLLFSLFFYFSFSNYLLRS